MEKRNSVVLLSIFFSFLVGGCATHSGVNFQGGDVTQAGLRSTVEELKKSEKDNLLWYLDAGIIAKNAREYQLSNYYFDKAEKKIKEYDLQILAGKALANIGSVLTNDNVMPYTPRIYEGVMLNTYKGINSMVMGRFDDARIEFNRALERQRRAKEFFQKEIARKRKEMEKSSSKNDGEEENDRARSAAEDSRTRDVIDQNYTNLFAFKSYPDFVNPFITYIAGLFFLLDGDYDKSADLLKESYGMIVDNEEGADYVKNDLLLALNGMNKIDPDTLSRHYASGCCP